MNSLGLQYFPDAISMGRAAVDLANCPRQVEGRSCGKLVHEARVKIKLNA